MADIAPADRAPAADEPNLRPRERVGLVIAVVALALALSPVNLRMRLWLRDDVFHGAPFWLDHLLFMMALSVLVWGALGFLLLGPRGMALGRPERPRQAWPVAVASGLALVAVLAAVLAALGALARADHWNWPVLFANFVSNFYEELIFRGAILGLLQKALGRGRPWLAMLISAVLFCQGHSHYPLPLLAAVFGAGLLWAWMTVRYRSLWPAWVSHMVADVVGDLLIKS